MQPIFTLSVFVFFISTVLCFLVSIVLLYYSWKNNFHNYWLAAFYFTAGYGSLISFLLDSRLIGNYPWYHLYRTGYIAALLLIPLSFFYVRSLLLQKRFKLIDLIHFLPVVIFIIDFIPFYLQPGLLKMQEAQNDALGLYTVWQRFSQGWIGVGAIYVPLRIFLLTLYFIWQWLIIKQSGKLIGGKELLEENKDIIRWVKIFWLLQLLYFIPYYVTFVFGDKTSLFIAAHTFSALGFSITMVLLTLQPSILYGLKGVLIKTGGNNINIITEPVINLTDSTVTEVKNDLTENLLESKRLNYIPQKKLQTINDLMINYLEKNQSYLNKGFTTRHLAAEMNIQPYLLSAAINQFHQTNINDFLNSYRILHAKKLIENGQGRLLTLEALAEQCGFSNRNSFTTAFKKHVGLTPSAFIKGQN